MDKIKFKSKFKLWHYSVLDKFHFSTKLLALTKYFTTMLLIIEALVISSIPRQRNVSRSESELTL